MAPYHALDGVPKQKPSVSTKAAPQTLSVRKDSGHNAVKPAAASAPPLRVRDLQAGPGSDTTKQAPAPTIRVIHIFAPKVIKTDMANFRSTVQKLTGRSTKKRGRRSARTAKTSTASDVAVQPHQPTTPSPATAGHLTVLWDQERRSQEAVLQRLVGDACGTNNMKFPLVRSSSVESTSTYSLDSDHFSSDSNEYTSTDHHAGLPSPSTAADSFSFYVPAHRESAYSLNEIPAPFFGADHMSPCCNVVTTSTTSPPFSSPPHGALGLQLPTPAMESMLHFDVDNLGSGLGSPLPLSEGCDVPFPIVGSGGSSGGGLYDMLSVQQHCRLSVQQPTFQGGNFFEMI